VIPDWVNEYTKLEWHPTAMNCWTLVSRVLEEQYGVPVPHYGGDSIDALDAAEVATLIAGHSVEWPTVWMAQSKTPLFHGDVHPGDLALFRVLRIPQHLGVVIDPPWFLHIEEGAESNLSKWTDSRWRSRLLGFYRHPALVGAAA
jgi:cell wall-associated NlpC family hydrolase